MKLGHLLFKRSKTIFYGLAFFVLGCLGGGNSGSETTNGLSGNVSDDGGRPASGTRILLLPENYNPAQSDSSALLRTTSDASGNYHLTDVAPGHYHIYMVDSSRGLNALIQAITVNADGGQIKVNGQLSKPGSVKIHISDYFGSHDFGYIYLPGSTSLLKIDSLSAQLGTVTISSFPIGNFDQLLLVIGNGVNQKTITLSQNFKVVSDSNSTLALYQGWKYSRSLSINTASVGVTELLLDFPLLVRLDSTNFDFIQAQANGSDLRFASSNGSVLSYQIENWDSLNKRAAIWVRIDTVQSTSPTQNLSMYWGQALSVTNQKNAKVFDSTFGFASVWHLNESANSDQDGYKDATLHSNNLSVKKINADAQITGVAGNAKKFNGNPDATGPLEGPIPQGLGGNAAFSITYWMKFETTAMRAIVFDFGTPGILHDFHFIIGADTTAQIGGMDINNSSGSTPATWQDSFKLTSYIATWAYIAITYDPLKGLLTTYVNGIKQDQKTTPALKIDANGGFRIGKVLSSNPTDAPYYGVIDEFRIYNNPISLGRIKLDYETQRP